MRFTREQITPEVLRELLDYNPETGKLTWKARDGKWFDNPNYKSQWNGHFAGTPALTNSLTTGYVAGYVLRNRMSAHRVGYAIFHGKMPEGEIDHINGNKLDNRISNLRDVTASGNMFNWENPHKAASGYRNVYKSYKNKWRIQFKFDGKDLVGGSFYDVDEAGYWANLVREEISDYHYGTSNTQRLV